MNLKSTQDAMEKNKEFQMAFDRLFEFCLENGKENLLFAVRDGYGRELSLERSARGEMVRVAVAAERERCAKLCEERFSDGALVIADAIRALGKG
jgi:hypothetical protein